MSLHWLRSDRLIRSRMRDLPAGSLVLTGRSSHEGILRPAMRVDWIDEDGDRTQCLIELPASQPAPACSLWTEERRDEVYFAVNYPVAFELDVSAEIPQTPFRNDAAGMLGVNPAGGYLLMAFRNSPDPAQRGVVAVDTTDWSITKASLKADVMTYFPIWRLVIQVQADLTEVVFSQPE